MVSGVGNVPGFSNADFSALRQALFQKSDANGSGGLSLEEFKAVGPKGANAPQSAPSVEEAFTQFDTDKSGELSAKELEAGAKQAFESRLQQGGLVSGSNVVQLSSSNFAQSIFDGADSNADGGLSLDEFKASKPQGGPSGAPSDEDIFAQLDADGDGSVTSNELQEGLKKGPPGGFGGAGGPGGAGGSPAGADASSIFGDSKTDKGGSSSSKSSSKDEDQDYDSRDTNKDGVVSASEKADADINALVSQTLQTLLGAQEQLAA